MGCPCEIQLYADDPAPASHAAEIAMADVGRLEAKYSRYREESLLSAINRVAASGGAIEVDAETAGLLNYADTCYRQSEGLFDITSGILRRAWRFDSGQLPDQALIARLLVGVGWDKVNWRAPVLEFPQAGMELDFGGIVKEYAVDRAAALCTQSGIGHGVVNLGGDVKLIGGRPDGRPWRVGIAHPRKAGDTLLTLSVEQGAVASSGDYERCVIVDGIRYGHILNPKTGWPVGHLAAVSVLAEHCVVAGSASTIALLKEAEGPAWLESLGLPHLWMDVEGRLGGSAGLINQVAGG
ncbi:FAD:protein FMN transferase [Methylococcus sp. EFPC2]|uniref:FAD:protein FMN transferase n=1 Tax=Methylococcus sp. EFPC2 TaxID=2812648 RepID=UPI001967ABA1|nr:FAD:protein FMN transferase [Methylococcus sp. EFPC2]QSA99186.1 FAD:protein FMN transferase [Methylococcus sp. EFPC2]